MIFSFFSIQAIALRFARFSSIYANLRDFCTCIANVQRRLCLFRRMFPYIQLTVSGLEKHERYYILLEIQPACNRRYKYCGNGAGQNENGNKGNIGGWSYAGPAEPQPHVNRRIYMHPDGPATGEHWMQNTISFSKLKLTNNVLECNNVSTHYIMNTHFIF